MMHYCGPESFFNIINTQSLWLSNIMNLRDPSERRSLLSSFKKQLESEFKDEKYQLLMDDIRNSINSRADYVVCFSNIDRGLELLNQWRSYANDAEGMAIWFNPEILCPYRYDPFSEERRTSDMFLSNVKYKDSLQDTAVQDAIAEIKQIADAYDCARSKEINDRLHLIVQRLGDRAVVCKNPCYSYENEVRLVYSKCSFDIGIDHCPDVKHIFTCVNGVISSRYVYPFKAESYESILFGPRCKSNCDDLNNYISSTMRPNTGKCYFGKSDIPYR